jgi:hypothetical protein
MEDQEHSLKPDASGNIAEKQARRRLIKATIAALPAIITLTAGPVSAGGGPSNAPSPGPDSLPPG